MKSERIEKNGQNPQGFCYAFPGRPKPRGFSIDDTGLRTETRDSTGLQTETRGSSDPYDIYYRKPQIKSGLNPTFYAYVYLFDHRHYLTSA